MSIVMATCTVALVQSQRQTDENYVLQAWTALNKGSYEAAIRKAQHIIDDDGTAAQREEKELQQARTPMPPVGSVGVSERLRILRRGSLNDVATAYYIIGRSAEYMKDQKKARDAYEQAVRLTYGRVYDPQGWFWSPAVAALDRLSQLK